MIPEEPHYLGHRKRLRERFPKSGLEGFADYEVVELLFTPAIPRSDVKEAAKTLIARFGNLYGIPDAPIAELETVRGFGGVAPVALKIITKEAATLYLQQSAEGQDCLPEPKRLTDFWRLRIGALRDKAFEVAHLDSGYRLLGDDVERLEEGIPDRAAVFSWPVVEAALRRAAYAVVLAHNHPSGRVEPNEQDKTLTRAIVLAAEAVGLKVLDHLIISADEVFSFRRAGLL